MSTDIIYIKKKIYIYIEKKNVISGSRQGNICFSFSYLEELLKLINNNKTIDIF